MIKFSVDYYNISTFFKTLDYSNKVILNAISDPLFIYDKDTNNYIPNSCLSYKNYHNKKYIIKIRKDLFYSNGKSVKAVDYVNQLNHIKNTILNEYFCNIKAITYTDYTIQILLYKKDKEFINKLSIYLITPIDNNVHSGRFEIYKTNNQLIFKPNKYYRNKSKEDLTFIKIDTLEDNINMFSKNKIDITNNTFIPLTNKNKNKEFSDIIYSLELSTKLSKKQREKIINCIDKNEIIKKLGNGYFVKNDFFSQSKSAYRIKKKKTNGNTQTLKLCYSNFYPNRTIAIIIKDLLEKNSYKVKLLECKYEDLKKNIDCDIKIVLNYFEYISDFYFYENKYFRFIMRNNIIYNWCIKNKRHKQLINYLFRKQYIKEPIISFYSNYSTNKKTAHFSYLECNYNKINR